MNIRGYMLEITWDGHTLTAQGTTKASQIALRGQARNDGPLVLTRDQITGTDLKPASRLANGHLDIHADNTRYRLHFRRKQANDFTQLAQALGATQV